MDIWRVSSFVSSRCVQVEVLPISLRRFGLSLLDDLRRPRGYLTILAFIIATQLPLFIATTTIDTLILTFIIGTAAIAWNIIGGFGGQLSLGNSMFFGISAYTLGIMLVTFKLGFLLSVIVAFVLTLIWGFIVGYPSFQLTGHYFALATITIVAGLRFLVRYFNRFTGGAQGLSLVPASTRGIMILDFEENTYYLLALVLFMFAFVVSIWVRRSKIGYYLMAIRDDQLAAASLGINVARFKMIGWLVTVSLTALAGVMYAVYVQFLAPDFSFSITQSVLYVVIPIIGGIGTLAGPVIGTFLIYPLQHILQTQFGGSIGSSVYVAYGVLLIFFIIYAPEGLHLKFKTISKPIANILPTFGNSESQSNSQIDETNSNDD